MIPRRNRELPFGRNSFLFSYKRRYNGNLCACSVQQAKAASSMMICTLSALAEYFLSTTVLCARNVSPTAYFLPTAGKVDRRGQIIFYEKVVCVSFVFPYRLFIDFGNGSFYDSGIIIAATSAVAEGACFIIPLCLLGIDRKNIVRPLDRYHSQHLLISV